MATIGDTVAYWRRRRGKSQHVLAGLAGISQPYLSQIERGHRTLDRRSTLVALADALQVSVEELSGRPGDPTDPVRARAAAHVPAIRETLIMREAGERRPPTGGLADLLAARARYDFARAAPMLPGLLAGAEGAELIQVCAVAISVLRHAGYPDLARDAARLCVTAGQVADDPAWLGTAHRLQVHALPAESRVGPWLAARAAADLQPRPGAERAGRAYGMLHLEAALRFATLGRVEAAADHLQEAEQVAVVLGDPADWDDLAQSCFGPSNVAMWRVTIAVELGDAERAINDGARVVPERVPHRHRQASWLVERMVTLAGAKRDAEATATFLRAESLCPQFVRLRPAARDAIAVIYRRTRRNAVPESLQRAAAMVGLSDR